MTFDLEAAKRLAEALAVDVLAQIEKDGSINRVNIAGQLLAGLVLEAAREQMKYRLFTQAANNQVGGLQSLIAEGPWPAAPSTGPGGDDRVVTNSQPIVAEIDDEMLAEIEKDMGPQSIVRGGGRTIARKAAERQAMRAAPDRMLVIPWREQNPQLGDIFAWRGERGLIVWRKADALIIEIDRVELDKLFQALIRAPAKAWEWTVVITDRRLVITRKGELLTDIEAIERGRV